MRLAARALAAWSFALALLEVDIGRLSTERLLAAGLLMWVPGEIADDPIAYLLRP